MSYGYRSRYQIYLLHPLNNSMKIYVIRYADIRDSRPTKSAVPLERSRDLVIFPGIAGKALAILAINMQ